MYLLFQAGAVPNVLDRDLRTPLMNCSEKGFTDIVKFLVRSGAVEDCKVTEHWQNVILKD